MEVTEVTASVAPGLALSKVKFQNWNYMILVALVLAFVLLHSLLDFKIFHSKCPLQKEIGPRPLIDKTPGPLSRIWNLTWLKYNQVTKRNTFLLKLKYVTTSKCHEMYNTHNWFPSDVCLAMKFSKQLRKVKRTHVLSPNFDSPSSWITSQKGNKIWGRGYHGPGIASLRGQATSVGKVYGNLLKGHQGQD